MNEPNVTHVTINQLSVAQAVAGEGIPVLLLHGWGANIGLMWPLAQRLVPLGYRVLVPDLPGSGSSALPSGAWSVYDYVNFVLAYLDHHGIDRVHLIGHSFGGKLGLILGADHSSKLNKMVLIDAAGIRPKASFSSQARVSTYRALRDGLAKIGMKPLSEGLRSWYSNRYGSSDFKNAGALRETFVKVVNEDLSTHAARVKVSTMLLWGENDEETPLWMAHSLEKTIPDAGLHIFPGAGHYSYLEHLPDTTHIIDYFFKH